MCREIPEVGLSFSAFLGNKQLNSHCTVTFTEALDHVTFGGGLPSAEHFKMAV